MQSKNLAVVIVTYNRLELLCQSLEKLEHQTYKMDKVVVINNASTDCVTKDFLDGYNGSLPLDVIHNPTNTGGAGGFYTGIKHAHEQGFEWIFIMDDDVFAHPDCIKNLMTVAHPCMIAVREYKDGSLVERAALDYNLSNPLVVNPKTKALGEHFHKRDNMPKTTEVDNVAFEGFMIHKEVIDKIGYPEPKYFIFYDDVDYALRARQAGYNILAVRDAILVRQLPFDQSGAINSWKAFYMFRNLFHIQYKFGRNLVVRNMPYVIALFASFFYMIKLGKSSVFHEIWSALKHHRKLSKPENKFP